MSSTVASLLGLLFGDVEALGTTALLRGGEERGLGDFQQWELSDMLVERFPDVSRPTLRFELNQLQDECGGDPLRLLRLAAERSGAASPLRWDQRFPVSIFAEPQRGGQTVPFEIADSHLHSGASVPLSLFFSALATSKLPVGGERLREKSLRSLNGQRWSLHALLSAARWALRLLRYTWDGKRLHDVVEVESAGFDPGVVSLVLEEAFWTRVAEEATGQGQRPTIERMCVKFEDDGECNVGQLFEGSVFGPEYDFPGRRPFAFGLVRACAAIATVVIARPGDGLSRFVDRFSEMGVARDSVLGARKADIVYETLHNVAGSDNVVGAEFRKSFRAAGRNEFRAEMVEELRSHHNGFARFAREKGRALALSMPVGFLRKPCSGRGGDWTDIEQLDEAVAGLNALRQILGGENGEVLAGAISAIDVAGDEYGSASWPYAAVAELLRRERLELTYAIHAGEAFTSPLNGVRRIGELFLADRAPDRIGHALALAPDAAKSICAGATTPPVRIGDAICDLAWTIVAGCGDADRAAELILDLAKGRGGRVIEPTVWVEAYRSLFQVDALLSHGILTRGVSEYGVETAEQLGDIAAGGGPSAKALIALAAGNPSVAYANVRELVPDPIAPAFAEFGRETAEAARAHVLGRVRDEGTLIEACPASNITLANLDGLQAHPLWEWTSDPRVGVVIGSDDPLLFGSTIVDEFNDMLEFAEANGYGRGRVEAIAEQGRECCSGGRRRSRREFDEIARGPKAFPLDEAA